VESTISLPFESLPAVPTKEHVIDVVKEEKEEEKENEKRMEFDHRDDEQLSSLQVKVNQIVEITAQDPELVQQILKSMDEDLEKALQFFLDPESTEPSDNNNNNIYFPTWNKNKTYTNNQTDNNNSNNNYSSSSSNNNNDNNNEKDDDNEVDWPSDNNESRNDDATSNGNDNHKTENYDDNNNNNSSSNNNNLNSNNYNSKNVRKHHHIEKSWDFDRPWGKSMLSTYTESGSTNTSTSSYNKPKQTFNSKDYQPDTINHFILVRPTEDSWEESPLCKEKRPTSLKIMCSEKLFGQIFSGEQLCDLFILCDRMDVPYLQKGVLQTLVENFNEIQWTPPFLSLPDEKKAQVSEHMQATWKWE